MKGSIHKVTVSLLGALQFILSVKSFFSVILSRFQGPPFCGRSSYQAVMSYHCLKQARGSSKRSSVAIPDHNQKYESQVLTLEIRSSP